MISNCLLCHNARCTEVCGKIDPGSIIRSLYFDNEDAVINRLDGNIPCIECDGRCEKACVANVNIREIISGLNARKPEKKIINYDCLKTDFCGIPLENPFLLSSSVVASTYEMCARAFEMGWAGAAFKTVCLMDIVEASPRFAAIKGDNGRIIGFKNIEQLSDHTLAENLSIFRRLKDNYPGKFLLVSIMGRDDAEWAYLAEVMNDSGADALELNFSCPNMTEGNTGSDVGQIPELVEHYCRIVKEHSRLPFIAKLTPNISDIRESADAAIAGGADGVAAINTIKSLVEVDIDPTDGIYNASIGGYSGKAVKPIALRFITELSKDKNLADKHISGMGGIETWRDALEFIVLGADSVQITTAVMLYGYRIIDDLRDGMALYLAEHGFSSVKEIENSTIEGIVPTDELDRSYIIYPKFIREKCVGCQRCLVSCMDGGHQAISFVEGRPVLDASKCVGCHLCVLVCPRKAIVSSEIRVSKKRIRKQKRV
ncbi:MAG: NAD-dependent dihydropyrimidine dehydrogenase subunit PreA [Erysipelotrichaceae bacterium]|nr:NAD-dependent dihydropyrimidine dehydrogenase subunit PreA [Erysipelotrichaceae bacterium]